MNEKLLNIETSDQGGSKWKKWIPEDWWKQAEVRMEYEPRSHSLEDFWHQKQKTEFKICNPEKRLCDQWELRCRVKIWKDEQSGNLRIKHGKAYDGGYSIICVFNEYFLNYSYISEIALGLRIIMVKKCT